MIELEMHKVTAGATEINDAITALAATLKAHPAYRALRTAYEVLQADEEAQQQLADLQVRQRLLPFSTNEQDEAEFQEQVERFYKLPPVAAYHEAEKALADLLKEVDSVISTGAGIEFATNAKRTCCGG